MNNAELRAFLTARSACRDAMEWLGNRDSAQMWAECQRPDWLLWWAGQIVPRRDLVLAACDCAETALRFVPGDEHRPRLAIQTARRWAHGEATLDEVAAAANAANAANAAEYAAPLSARADAYAAHAAARAAYAAAFAADLAAYAAHAAARAAYAANAAGYAAEYAAGYYADAAGYYAARSAMLQLIRQRWPQCPMRVDEVAQ